MGKYIKSSHKNYFLIILFSILMSNQTYNDCSICLNGLYEGYLRLVTSGGNAGLPVSMLVSGNPSQPGDINGDESVNIQDIIFLINFILDVDSPDENQFSAADMNNDGVLNIQDIILIINTILS